jgi:hypothetical protein
MKKLYCNKCRVQWKRNCCCTKAYNPDKQTIKTITGFHTTNFNWALTVIPVED